MTLRSGSSGSRMSSHDATSVGRCNEGVPSRVTTVPLDIRFDDNRGAQLQAWSGVATHPVWMKTVPVIEFNVTRDGNIQQLTWVDVQGVTRQFVPHSPPWAVDAGARIIVFCRDDGEPERATIDRSEPLIEEATDEELGDALMGLARILEETGE